MLMSGTKFFKHPSLGMNDQILVRIYRSSDKHKDIQSFERIMHVEFLKIFKILYINSAEASILITSAKCNLAESCRNKYLIV